jgi:hypothetical protein
MIFFFKQLRTEKWDTKKSLVYSSQAPVSGHRSNFTDPDIEAKYIFVIFKARYETKKLWVISLWIVKMPKILPVESKYRE